MKPSAFSDTQLTEGLIILMTTITISGLNHTACTLDSPGFVLPLLGLHAGFTVGIELRRAQP